MTGKIIRPAPAEIEYRDMRFLITEQPHDTNMVSLTFEYRVQGHEVPHHRAATRHQHGELNIYSHYRDMRFLITEQLHDTNMVSLTFGYRVHGHEVPHHRAATRHQHREPNI